MPCGCDSGFTVASVSSGGVTVGNGTPGNASSSASSSELTSTYFANASSGEKLRYYFHNLKARICPKCSTFWIVLAIVALAIYLFRKR